MNLLELGSGKQKAENRAAGEGLDTPSHRGKGISELKLDWQLCGGYHYFSNQAVSRNCDQNQ